MMMIAGPNGAGKTTLYRQLLQPALEEVIGGNYINADDIEREMHDGQAYKPDRHFSKLAQQEADRRRESYLQQNQVSNFAFETVFSDEHGYKLEYMERARKAGYVVALVFVGLNTVELSHERVKRRVAESGHEVPAEAIEARFPRVYANLIKGLKLAHVALLVDNSNPMTDVLAHQMVAVYTDGEVSGLDHDKLPVWWQFLKPTSN